MIVWENEQNIISPVNISRKYKNWVAEGDWGAKTSSKCASYKWKSYPKKVPRACHLEAFYTSKFQNHSTHSISIYMCSITINLKTVDIANYHYYRFNT